MPYNENLADRVREILQHEEGIIEKKMFGGICFMLRDKMCIGIVKNDLMVRCLQQRFDELLEKAGVGPMDFTGKPMRGFLFVGLENLKTNKQLKWWLEVGVEFARNFSDKKKKRK